MWRQDIAEEKQAEPPMARGCLGRSINAKQTTSLGKEDISLFISTPPHTPSAILSELTLILKTERGGCRDRERHRWAGKERTAG